MEKLEMFIYRITWTFNAITGRLQRKGFYKERLTVREILKLGWGVGK